ncbi:hypothetical protein [Nocardia cyriacigeorgica]|jgi:hypothetical protein|uniref:hypothetical protein n=1 Tax=Nocardia cyriacigeorgica TaxID=135487 RepID=UPI000CEA33BE|nr:hypothetical protein [Nocardia cyriacigeorgica]AVH20359.1 hypothetical protein C5B73_01590 [Nocardia cyriacigeorgica]MBF6325909.1 hypothetical protein [Nocardia cyriacigeorgica]PPJ04155.1 hypothetical protein C5E43_23860 [Nocardia cyriacigeorgica]
MKTDNELGAPWADTLPSEAPVVHRNLDVAVGHRQLTTLTRDHLHYWMGQLRSRRLQPFITVARADRPPFFIQTYRHSDNDYRLEVHPGDEHHYLAVTLDDESEVEQLLWDWLENDWQRLDAIDWEHHTL